MLVLLSSIKTAVKVGTTVIGTTLQAMSCWPRFYWSLLGPSSQGKSIYAILHQGFRVPSSLRTEANRSKQMQHDLSHVLDCLGVYSSSVQVPRASKHLAQSPNRSMAEAVNQASSPLLLFGSDPLRISQLQKWLANQLPTLPDGSLLHVISLVTILAIYLCMIIRGILRIGYLRFYTKAHYVKKNSSQGQVKRRTSKGKHFCRRKKKSTLRRLHIKMFMATQATTSECFSADTDGLPFVIDNSATGAIHMQ